MKKPQANDLAMHVWRILGAAGDPRSLLECAEIAGRMKASGDVERYGADEALRRAMPSGEENREFGPLGIQSPEEPVLTESTAR